MKTLTVKNALLRDLNRIREYHSDKPILNKLWENIKYDVIDNIIVIDCRSNDILTIEGNSFFGSEKANYLLSHGKDKYYFSSIVSSSGYKLTDDKILDAIKDFKSYSKRFNDAAKSLMVALDGGSCTYKPMFIALSNYGYSIYGKEYVVTGYNF